MPTQLLAVGSTKADSTDLVLASGASATVCMKGAKNGAVAVVSIKDDAGTFQVLNARLEMGEAMSIAGPGTYRFTREAGQTFGVFSA